VRVQEQEQDQEGKEEDREGKEGQEGHHHAGEVRSQIYSR
jgi:hypothetical protein